MSRRRKSRTLIAQRRLLILGSVVVSGLVCLTLRATHLQALDGARLAAIARRQAETTLKLALIIS